MRQCGATAPIHGLAGPLRAQASARVPGGNRRPKPGNAATKKIATPAPSPHVRLRLTPAGHRRNGFSCGAIAADLITTLSGLRCVCSCARPRAVKALERVRKTWRSSRSAILRGAVCRPKDQVVRAISPNQAGHVRRPGAGGASITHVINSAPVATLPTTRAVADQRRGTFASPGA